jgi:hypothetical protein
VKVGNSRALRIQKSPFEEVGLVDEADLGAVDGEPRVSAAERAAGIILAAFSESALDDWNRPEEDTAWNDL